MGQPQSLTGAWIDLQHTNSEEESLKLRSWERGEEKIEEDMETWRLVHISNGKYINAKQSGHGLTTDY